MNGLFCKDFFLPSSSPLFPEEKERTGRILFFLVLASFLLKLLYLVPGTGDPEIYLRPDSPSYLAPARSLLYDLTYSTGAGTGEAALHRTPLYPCFLALCLGISGGSLLFVAAVSAFLSSLTLIPLFLSAKIFLPEKYALFASLLFLLHPTVFAVFPLVTSDTLFLLLVTLVLYFYLRFLKERSLSFLLWSAFAATLAVLTRPLMLFWGFPALFVLFCQPRFPLKKKVLFSLLFLLVFFLLPACWILRNHARGGGWRIDIVSADTAKHNVSTFESRRNGIPAYVLREQYDREAEEAYRKEPEKYASLSARLAFHEERLIRTMKEHPFSYFLLHFRPEVLLPDGAAFFENLRLTRSGRNTWDIINRKGILAGIRHYFGGNLLLPFTAFPLFLLAGFVLLFAAGGVLVSLWKKSYFTVLLFLLFCEYFLFMTGPVAMPRYQLPALPFFCILAAGFMQFCRETFRKKKEEKKDASSAKQD